MAIKWITKKGILGSFYENQEVYITIAYDENPDIKLEIISGDLPNGTSFVKINDSQYAIKGVLSIVSETTTYKFTVRATLNDEFSDRYFEIITETYDIDWVSETIFEETQEYSYVSKYFQLRNPNGNEEFIKTSGRLPEGLTLNKNGLLYGTIGQIPESTDYKFSIGVFVDGVLTLEKDFYIIVHKLGELNLPIWITQEGLLGYLNYNEESTLKINAYEPMGRQLQFEIVEGRLPEGLELEKSTAKITGRVLTDNEATWEFSVNCNNGFNIITRTFSIMTNIVNEEDRIVWLSDEKLGEFSIGQNVEMSLNVKSKHPVSFSMLEGKLPKRLSLNKNGLIYGKVDFQELKDYKFTIIAKSYKTEELKTFQISIKRGLGKNAIKSYFYINLEYLNQYNELKNCFDYKTAYKSYDINYMTPYKPEVFVANLSCYDKVLLQNIIQFNLPLHLMSKKIKMKQVVIEEEHKYDVFYKELQESNGSYEDEYINYLSNKQYIKQNDNGIWVDEKTGEQVNISGDIIKEDVISHYIISTDEITYKVNIAHQGMWIRTSDRTVVYGNPKISSETYFVDKVYKVRYYYMDGYNKIIVEQLLQDMYFDTETLKIIDGLDPFIDEAQAIYEAKYYFRSPLITYTNVPSIHEIRNRLEQQFIIKKLNKDVWYDINTEEFVDVENDKVYEIKYDDEAQSYYIDYDNIPQEVELVVYDPKTGEIFDDTTLLVNNTEYFDKVIVLGKNEYGKVWVNYKNFEVINKVNHKQYRNTLFKLPHIDKPFTIDANGVVHFVQKTNIAERNWYWFDKNDNIIDMNSIVLPYIMDEDVENDDGILTLQFFNSLDEQLPEWMDNTYFPKIDIFYSEAGKNYQKYIDITNRENNLELLTERKFVFYCLSFKPIFNRQIAPFDIFFDYHNYNMSPHKLI